MKLTHYGKDVLLKVFAVGIVLIILSLLFDNTILKIIFIAVTIFLWLFSLYFFRDPERKIPDGLSDVQIISPADGKIVVIEEVINKEKNIFEKGENLIQISIFLSPLNVHVNRIPMNGLVKYLNYIKGDYLVAFDPKSSERNERSEIGIENEKTGKIILFKQIAGFVARRIVYDIKVGSKVNAGDKFGMIKFGSRVDILLKKDTSVLVKMNQIVTGGETIIAEM